MIIATDEAASTSRSEQDGQPAPRTRWAALRRPAAGPEQPAPRFAVVILLVMLGTYSFQIGVNLLVVRPGSSASFVGLACLLAVDALQMVHSLPRAQALRNRYGRWTLAAQAVLTFAPIVLYGRIWGSVGGFLCGSALLVLPPLAGWSMFTLVATAVSVIGALNGSTFDQWLYITISTVATGLMVYSLSKMVTLLIELHRARGQLARMAVAQERLRFARDLHDLLGYSLSAITLKSEVAIRLVNHHQSRAVDELTSILGISRQALSDVREVASSYRDMSLTTEVEAAGAMLATAEIEVKTEISGPPIAGRADTVLATVLREAVTNMLRHSKVQHCLIEVLEHDRTVRLRIVNDGVSQEKPTDSERQGTRAGSGLGNLDSRVRALGGRLAAGVRPDGRFEVLAEIPMEATRPVLRTAGSEAADLRAEAA
ncbi:two-component system sensor histidine kinase DesK [Kitasatospora sp. MAP12-15]|uniref:sensor histidine kinase n=1 Tax=unclassified Kitasatospora TaxID=2633591 RepID=UPI0024756400|nr:histidine kinase [Kitasatospora sp. MAP12-44]MDH6110622.1 two-component system sensor histidine kinase DesK [Kitasatospora sp. MAP12-44]